jgi:hypothetical protein
LDQVANTLWSLECDGLEPSVVDELLREAELRQAAMFNASIGMDQRAAVISAGLIAAAGALGAAGAALPGADNIHLRHGAFSMAAMLAVAAAFCIYACRPQTCRFPGIEPMEWAHDRGYLTHGIIPLKLARAAKIQDEMTQNEAQQKRNGRSIVAGLLIAAAAPVIGIIFSLS